MDIPYLRIGRAGATNESRFISKAASVHAHFKSIKFGIKQHKGVWPRKKKKKGRLVSHGHTDRDTRQDVANGTAY